MMIDPAVVDDMTWTVALGEEKQKPYFQQIMHFLKQERAANKIIYPLQADIFNAFKLTDYFDTKVVIIGQDPYHGAKQAMGLCFAVNKGIPIPPSLRNIYLELKNDLQIQPVNHGDLSFWAQQGVLLLNATLTVEAHKPQSHANIGWQTFTDSVITALNEHPKPIIYLLWGAYAQKKAQLIDQTKHQILKTTHPSPLSAHRGFMGSRVFSKTNQLLKQLGRSEINWQLPED